MEEDSSLRVMYEARRQARGEEPEPKVHHWRRRFAIGGAGVVAISAVLITGYGWWSYTHVRTVTATVRAALISLSPLTDARVQQLYVRPGEVVKKDQLLVRMDASEAQAALAGADANRIIAESKFVQAQATARRTADRVKADVALAQSGVDIAVARVASARASLDVRKARLPEEIHRAQADRDQAKSKLDRIKNGARPEDLEAAKARLATAKDLASLYTLELKQTEDLVAQGLESVTTLQTKRAQVTAQEGVARQAQLALDQMIAGPTKEEIEGAEQALASQEAALTLAQAAAKEVDALQADLAMRDAEERQARSQLEQAEAALVDAELANEQVKVAEADLHRTEADCKGRQAVLDSMSLTSPVEGTVIRTFNHVGEVCKKGETVILVADDGAGRWVEGYVREEDADYLHEGQKAEVILSTRDSLRAFVNEVGLSTSSLGRPSGAAPADASAARSPTETVWVRLRFADSSSRPLPGRNAYVNIRVR